MRGACLDTFVSVRSQSGGRAYTGATPFDTKVQSPRTPFPDVIESWHPTNGIHPASIVRNISRTDPDSMHSCSTRVKPDGGFQCV